MGALLALAGLGAFAATRFWWPARPVPALILRAGIEAMEADDREKALRLFDEVLERDPSNAWALVYRGELARNLGDLEGALNFWAQVSDERRQPAAAARYF